MSADVAAKPLQNAKHEAVLQAYFADRERIGYRAYLVVYPGSSQAAAQTAFSRLLRRAEFAERLAFFDRGVTEVAIEKSGIQIAEVVAELAKIGFANMLDYAGVTNDGDPFVDMSKLTRDQAAAISSFVVEDYKDGRGEDARDVKKVSFKLHNKQAALVSILEHLGGFPAQKHADPDGRPVGTGAAEKLTDLEVARRLAFMLAKGDRAKPRK